MEVSGWGKTSRSWVFSIANYFLVSNIDVETLDASQLKDFQYKVSPTLKKDLQRTGASYWFKASITFSNWRLEDLLFQLSSSLQGPFWNLRCSLERLFRCRTGSRNRPSCCRSPAIPTNWRRRWPEIQPGSGKKQLPQLWQASNFRNSIEVFVRKYIYIHLYLYRHMYFIINYMILE